MSTHPMPGHRPARLLLGLAAAALSLAPLTAQERPQSRPDRPARVELIERLELGISALETLGHGAEAERLRRIAEDLRQADRADRRPDARAGGGGGAGELDDRGRRLEILRWARDAQAEAGRPDAAETLVRFLHLGELQLEGAGDEAIARASQGLDPRGLVELVRESSGLWAQWGWERRAAACAELADHYAVQHGLGAERASKAESASGLETLRGRLQVLRWARNAHAEVRRHEALVALDPAIRVGELQLAGAAERHVAEAYEGLDMAAVIERLQEAAGQYREWGDLVRARACNALAERYAGRERAAGDLARDSSSPGALDRVLAQRVVRALRYAEGAFREAEREDAADLALRHLHVIEDRLAAGSTRVGAPQDPGEILELLAGSSRLQREWGHAEVARFTESVASELRQQLRPRGGRTESVQRDETSRDLQIQALARRLEELQRELEATKRAMGELAGGR